MRLETLATGDDEGRDQELREQYALYLDLHSKVIELARQNGNNRAFELASGKGQDLVEKSLALMENIVRKAKRTWRRTRLQATVITVPLETC